MSEDVNSSDDESKKIMKIKPGLLKSLSYFTICVLVVAKMKLYK